MDENNRAVMVWIHGGGFATGNPGREDYGPDYFLNENVIVVAIAYRLGVLGETDSCLWCFINNFD